MAADLEEQLANEQHILDDVGTCLERVDVTDDSRTLALTGLVSR